MNSSFQANLFQKWIKDLLIILFFFCLLVASVHFNCSREDGGEEVKEKNYDPGRRDYTWEWDTLETGLYYSMESMWGSAPDDIWLTGAPLASFNLTDQLWHYDGVSWSVYKKEAILTEANVVFGIDRNNVWIGGEYYIDPEEGICRGAAIWYYDGNEWKEQFVYTRENVYMIELQSFAGSDENDLYACGTACYKVGEDEYYHRGFLLHFDGKEWKEIYYADFDSQFCRMFAFQDQIYIISTSIITWEAYLYKYSPETGKMIEIQRPVENGRYLTRLKLISDSLFVTQSSNIYQIENNELKFFLDVPFSVNSVWHFSGRHTRDIFHYLSDGIVHYNGSDYKYLIEYLPRSTGHYCYALYFENELFKHFYDWSLGKDLILHGTLK